MSLYPISEELNKSVELGARTSFSVREYSYSYSSFSEPSMLASGGSEMRFSPRCAAVSSFVFRAMNAKNIKGRIMLVC